jgi:maltose alpha-D-glucosyltransferase/alpha-amylase
MIEKAVYELAYELNNRPDWLAAPARGLIALLEARTEARNEA